MNAGAIVYQILMQGAAVFKKDSADADQAVKALGRSSDESAAKVTKAGNEVDGLGKKAKAAKAPLDEQAKSTKKVGDESDDAKKKVKGLGDETQTLKQAMTGVGATALGIGAAIALVGGLAISTYSEFDAAMSRTAAATMATQAQQKELGDAAVKAGADTVYSAKESADAETELAKAGLSVHNILTGGLTGSLSLAAAGQLDVARAAEIAAITLKQFNLDGTQTGRVADVLAAGAGKAVGSVDDLANGLKYVGPIASAMGISLEDTVGTLSLFADQGILGEQAGTSLRGMLSSLTSPSKQAAKEIENLGITLYDGNGKFLGLSNAANQLQGAYQGMTDEAKDASLGVLFGNEQVTAARVLYKAGAAGVKEYADAVRDQGYAARQAYEMTNNLQGDVERLGGAWDSAMIQTGAPANDVLREMVQLLTGLVDWYGQLPAPVQTTALVVGIAAAAVTLFGGSLLVAVPRIAEFRLAVATLSTEMPRATSAVKSFTAFMGGPWGIVIAAATAVLGIFISKQLEGVEKANLYKGTLDEVTGAITEQTRAATAANLAAKGDWWSIYGDDSAADSAKKLKISLNDVTDAVYGNADAMKKIQDQYDTVYSGGAGNADKRAQNAKDLGLSATEYKNAVAILYDAVKSEQGAIAGGQDTKANEIELNKKLSESTGQSSSSAQTAANSYLDAAKGANALLGELTQLIGVVNKANGVGQDAVSANVAYQEALSKADEAVRKASDGAEGYGFTLDIATEAGRRNNGALVDIASSGQAAADKQFALDQNTQNYRATLEGTRQAVYDHAIALGANADEAQAVADKIAAIPSDSEWKMVTETAAATADIQRIIDLLKSVPSTRQTSIGVTTESDGLLRKADGGRVSYYANGGRENHIAQFARAGSVRVWAEPETGGEWYIPAAPSKRGRSTQILAAAANEFGFGLAPLGAGPAAAFADGGRYGAGGAGGGYVDQSQTTVQLNGTNLDPDDVAAAIERERIKRARARG